MITRFGLPSFIVTLGGLLAFQGVMLELASVDKTADGRRHLDPLRQPDRQAHIASQMSATVSWIVLIVVIVVFATATLYSVRSRRSEGPDRAADERLAADDRRRRGVPASCSC